MSRSSEMDTMQTLKQILFVDEETDILKAVSSLLDQ